MARHRTPSASKRASMPQATAIPIGKATVYVEPAGDEVRLTIYIGDILDHSARYPTIVAAINEARQRILNGRTL